MALKTSLRLIARRIARAVQKSTGTLGLLPGDYALVGSFDEKTDRISLVLGTDKSVDELRLYSETLQEIRGSFPEDPYFTMHVGIVIRRVPDLDEVYWDSGIGENEIDLTELFERS